MPGVGQRVARHGLHDGAGDPEPGAGHDRGDRARQAEVEHGGGVGRVAARGPGEDAQHLVEGDRPRADGEAQHDGEGQQGQGGQEGEEARAGAPGASRRSRGTADRERSGHRHDD